MYRIVFDEVSSPRQLTLTNLPDVVRNVSLFVKDLLTLLDRPTALELVYQLNDAIRANSDPLVQLLPRVHRSLGYVLLTFLKFDMLRILSDHEHWVPLNLPSPVRITNITTLTEDFWCAFSGIGCDITQCYQDSPPTGRPVPRRGYGAARRGRQAGTQQGAGVHAGAGVEARPGPALPGPRGQGPHHRHVLPIPAHCTSSLHCPRVPRSLSLTFIRPWSVRS